MPDIIIRRKHFDKEVVRKINIDRVGKEYVAGVVAGLRIAFDQQEYELDLSEVERSQKQIEDQATVANAAERVLKTSSS